MGEIVLVRHGETTWSASGRHASTTDLDLTDEGEAQTKALAPILAGRRFAAVWSSPRTRAVRTAELAGLEVDAVKDDLAEWAYGDYEGLTGEQIHDIDPRWTVWSDGGKGGSGESPAAVAARLDRVLEEARGLLPSGDVAFVAHGYSLRAAAARWLGRPVGEGRAYKLGPASISVLGLEQGRPAIALWNLTAALLRP